MPTIYLTKVQGKQPGMIGFGDDDIAALEKLKPGKRYRAKVVEDRSLPFHRLMFRVFRLVAEILNDGPVGANYDEDLVRRQLLIALGYAEFRPATPVERKAYGLNPVGKVGLLVSAARWVVELADRWPGLSSFPLIAGAIRSLREALEAPGEFDDCFVLVPQSMAFERMDQRQAYEFFELAVQWLLANFQWAEDHPNWVAVLETVGLMEPQLEEEAAQ